MSTTTAVTKLPDVLQIRSGRPQPHVLGHILGIGHAPEQPAGRAENRWSMPLPFRSERILLLRPSGLVPVTHTDRDLPSA
jgi:hypothetical protein